MMRRLNTKKPQPKPFKITAPFVVKDIRYKIHENKINTYISFSGNKNGIESLFSKAGLEFETIENKIQIEGTYSNTVKLLDTLRTSSHITRKDAGIILANWRRCKSEAGLEFETIENKIQIEGTYSNTVKLLDTLRTSLHITRKDAGIILANWRRCKNELHALNGFTLTVLVCDGYLNYISGQKSPQQMEIIRLFKIATQLPIELQMLLWFRIYGSPAQTMRSEDVTSSTKRILTLATV
jgi:hypothetical protein